MSAAAEGIGSRAALIEALATGTRVEYLHFWRHRPLPDGRIGPSCLSQWWPSPFTVDGVEYATAEHWMMAAKARLFGDPEGERRALAAGHPAEAQKAGRLVRGFDEAIWRRERFGIVVEGNVHKFASDADLRGFLLNTGERSEMGVPPAGGWGEGAGRGEPAGPGVGHRARGGRRGGDGPGAVAGTESAGLRPDGGPRAAPHHGTPDERDTGTLTPARGPSGPPGHLIRAALWVTASGAHPARADPQGRGEPREQPPTHPHPHPTAPRTAEDGIDATPRIPAR